MINSIRYWVKTILVSAVLAVQYRSFRPFKIAFEQNDDSDFVRPEKIEELDEWGKLMADMSSEDADTRNAALSTWRETKKRNEVFFKGIVQDYDAEEAHAPGTPLDQTPGWDDDDQFDRPEDQEGFEQTATAAEILRARENRELTQAIRDNQADYEKLDKDWGFGEESPVLARQEMVLMEEVVRDAYINDPITVLNSFPIHKCPYTLWELVEIGKLLEEDPDLLISEARRLIEDGGYTGDEGQEAARPCDAEAGRAM